MEGRHGILKSDFNAQALRVSAASVRPLTPNPNPNPSLNPTLPPALTLTLTLTLTLGALPYSPLQPLTNSYNPLQPPTLTRCAWTTWSRGATYASSRLTSRATSRRCYTNPHPHPHPHPAPDPDPTPNPNKVRDGAALTLPAAPTEEALLGGLSRRG